MKIFLVKSNSEGIEKAKELLYEKVTSQTLLFLSGGSSPKSLYETLAEEKLLHPGAVAMIDERYGNVMHEKSNEKMIIDTGLLHSLKERHIPWYPILQRDLTREETTERYETAIRDLVTKFPRKVALVSLGTDGHTAGLPAQISKRKSQNSKIYTSSAFVTTYNDTTGKYGERITLTYVALSMMDYFLLWVFGDEKKDALKKIFEKGSEAEVPEDSI